MPLPLNVLHISTWDNLGGSGRAAYRLHTGLKRLGMLSRMLVGYKSTGDDDVRVIGGRLFGRPDKLCGKVVDQLGLQYVCYPSSFMLTRTRWVHEANVVQLFNTHGGYFSHLVLAALSRDRPVVWRLSDMWPVTGHCGYSYECERWKTGCGSCPHLSEYPALRIDTTAFLWRLKQRVYNRSRLTIVAPSRWMADIAKDSPLLNRFPIHVIRNGVDTQVYHPIPKADARRRLGIETDTRVILFSASSILLERKGAAYLKDALRRLWDEGSRDMTLLIAGGDADRWESHIRFPTKSLGAVRDEGRMAIAYAAADAFVLPTVAENFPNAIIESMACGTPAVSFDVGGVSDAVRHMETGYLAASRDAVDFAKGIRMLMDDPGIRKKMTRRCREVVVEEYSLELQARRFAELYRDVVDQCRSETK